MNNLNKEIYYVQNPALGSAILWRFIYGYYSLESQPAPFPLLFIVLPIILREDLSSIIASTRKKSGLSKVSEKLFSEKKNDNLYSISNVAIAMRPLTLDSFNIGIATNLYGMDKESALVYPMRETKMPNIPPAVKSLLNASEKLGAWCAQLSLREISNLLKVRF